MVDSFWRLSTFDDRGGSLLRYRNVGVVCLGKEVHLCQISERCRYQPLKSEPITSERFVYRNHARFAEKLADDSGTADNRRSAVDYDVSVASRAKDRREA